MPSLVTGASGFIGSHIAEALKARGEDVIALVRRTSDKRFLETLAVEFRYADLSDAEAVKEALKGVDRVYHSAALVDEWISRRAAYRSNVTGTKNLLDAALQNGVKRFVFVSSLAVLGMKDHFHTKADSPRQKTGDPYIDTKIDSEELVFNYYKDKGLPVTAVRPGFVFGPRDKKLIPRIIDKLERDKFMFIGSGKNKMNIVYVENLVDAIISAGYSDRAVGQAYNVTNGGDIELEKFIFKMSDMWGIKRPSKHVPKPAAYAACAILEGWARLTGSKKPPYITRTRIKFLSLNLDFDIDKTRKDLGYDPRISIEEGLERTKDWLAST